MNTSYDHHDPPPLRRTDSTDLSPREGEILRMIAAGYTDTQVAAALDISEGTVKTHVKRLLRKLEARNRAHAVDLGWRRGLLGGDTGGNR